MTFDLRFNDTQSDPDALVGTIALDRRPETFVASVSVWDKRAYEDHWCASAQAILARRPACFVTGIERTGRVLGERWIAWPTGDQIVMQNHLILDSTAFDLTAPNRSIPPEPRYVDDEGNEISTWMVTREDLGRWLTARCCGPG